MIVQLTGNINYNITLDPTVWIFDDRKVLFEEAFSNSQDKEQVEIDALEITANRWSQEVYQHRTRPPVNKSISKFEREKILKNSYVMPIYEFLSHAEVKPNTTDVTLVTLNHDVNITLAELQDCYLLFAIKGKPLKNDGPVHLYFKDGSNQDNPITGIQKIIVNK